MEQNKKKRVWKYAVTKNNITEINKSYEKPTRWHQEQDYLTSQKTDAYWAKENVEVRGKF
jgi:hypothetical protein